MNKTSIIVAALVVLVVGGVVAATQLNKDPNTDMSSMEGMDSSQMSSNSMDQSEQDLTAQKEVAMDIKSFDFAQPNIKVKVGTKVTWTNQDTAKHNVVSEGESTEMIAGELLAKGESFSYTFTKPGMTMYLCEPHPYMKGVINVVE